MASVLVRSAIVSAVLVHALILQDVVAGHRTASRGIDLRAGVKTGAAVAQEKPSVLPPPAARVDETPATSGTPQSTASPAVSAETVSFDRLIDDYGALRVGTASTEVKDVTLTSGHLALTLASGRACPVLAGDTAVGLYFEGKGQYTYTSVNRDEAAVMKYNISAGTRLAAESEHGSVTVSDDFKHLLYVTAGAPVPALTGKSGPSLEKSFRSHREYFLKSRSTPLAHEFARHRLTAPHGSLVRGEIGGIREDVVYLFDPELERGEKVDALEKITFGAPELKRRLHSASISFQPLGRTDRQVPFPELQLTHLDLTVAASDGKDVALTAVETLVPKRENLCVLRFFLREALYPRAPSGIYDPRYLRIKGVFDASGQSLPYHFENDDLLVALPSAPQKAVPLTMRFELAGDILVQPSGDNYWQLDQNECFPQVSITDTGYTFRATVKVKKPFVPFVTGITMSRHEEGDYNTVESRWDRPTDYIGILAGKYFVHEDTREGLTVRVATYALQDKLAMQRLTDNAFYILDYYEALLGAFPSRELNIFEINDWGWGEAAPATVFITTEVFKPTSGLKNQIFAQGADQRFAHEIAHQYWGVALRVASVEDVWLSEAFSEYMSALLLGKVRGAAHFDATVKAWRTSAEQALLTSSIPMAHRVSVLGDPGASSSRRRVLIYDKGAYLLARLHANLGDAAFYGFLRKLFSDYKWNAASTADAITVMKETSGKDMSRFFDDNFWGTGLPK